MRTYAENLKGKLKVGMLADFVVLSEDIEAVPTNDIPSIVPIVTVSGGNITYETTH
jgi:predicted amidohydrolase YtcJ